jgi:2-dehydro-3-deoxyphosphooctonate aldolase (KDO 8-P synthase)
MRTVTIGEFEIGAGADQLTLIAGPCVIESLDLCREVVLNVKSLCVLVGLNFVFKASFDKANRTSAASFRGSGMDSGLEVLAAIRSEFGVPILTDVHETWQAKPVAEVVDILQIPAFLCRQTDLLHAAGETGKAVNVKKGQFLAPWDMANVAKKIAETGNENIVLTERGASFGYNMLVVDMTSLPQMRTLGYPVCFDATHSVQRPGGQGTTSGGAREFVPHLARAAAAVGIDALFMEVHPNPETGLSDTATMLPLADLPDLLEQVWVIDNVLRADEPPLD